jgi:hypothetical protein
MQYCSKEARHPLILLPFSSGCSIGCSWPLPSLRWGLRSSLRGPWTGLWLFITPPLKIPMSEMSLICTTCTIHSEHHQRQARKQLSISHQTCCVFAGTIPENTDWWLRWTWDFAILVFKYHNLPFTTLDLLCLPQLLFQSLP